MIDGENQNIRRIGFCLSVFHSVINILNKYKGLGWNDEYSFT